MAKIVFKSVAAPQSQSVRVESIPLDFIKVTDGQAVLHYGAGQTEVLEGFSPAWSRFSVFPDTLTTEKGGKQVPLKPYGDNVAFFRQTERPDIYRLSGMPKPRVDLTTMTDEQFVAYSQAKAQGQRAYFQRGEAARRPRTPMISRPF